MIILKFQCILTKTESTNGCAPNSLSQNKPLKLQQSDLYKTTKNKCQTDLDKEIQQANI
jgi:hypothetical protein